MSWIVDENVVLGIRSIRNGRRPGRRSHWKIRRTYTNETASQDLKISLLNDSAKICDMIQCKQ